MSEDTEAFFTVPVDAETWRPDIETEGEPDELHPCWKERNPHYALTETLYFNFLVPEEKLSALLYMWHHPNLGVVSAGPLVFRGIRQDVFEADIFDYRAWMSDADLPTDLGRVQFDNGYTVEKTGRSFHLTYSDSFTGNAIDIWQNPVSDRIFWPGGKHFEQVMRVTGEVLLDGRRIAVDSYSVRDRSWGEARLEAPVNAPPPAWITGVFNEGFAFNVTATDDPTRDPVWAGAFDIRTQDALKFGWIIFDGKTTAITSISKKTIYSGNRLMPTGLHMRVTDQDGRTFDISGTVEASIPFSPSPNVRAIIAMARWECDGQLGYGEIQDIQWLSSMRSAQGRVPG